jgi:hypothetical protein
MSRMVQILVLSLIVALPICATSQSTHRIVIGGVVHYDQTLIRQSVIADLPTVGIQPNSMLDMEKLVGEEVCFTLTAKDKNGNIIRSWKNNGIATTLTLKGSTANTDTSTQSWNADPQGYSWAVINFNGTELTRISANEWSIPATDFDDNGQARVCLIHTKAERGVYIEVTPTTAGLNQVTDKINFRADAVTNYLVELTSSTAAGNEIFHMRPFEIVVSPRDRYLNISSETIPTRFTARFPGEFDATGTGLSDIFSGTVFITGPTNYLLASRIVRELAGDQLQWIMAYAEADNHINGVTNPFKVLSHAPKPFALQTPVDHAILALNLARAQQDFDWEKPVPADPYTNIQVSRFNPTTYTDDVTYTWVMVDSVSLTRAERAASNNTGALPKLTLTHAQLSDIVYRLTGTQTTKRYNAVWYVEATDGLYTTPSSPPYNDPNSRPGHRISFDITTSVPSVPAPGKLQLQQNYPNPFNPSTTISFSIPTDGKVLLRVFDLLGAPVATVLNEDMEAGDHTVHFNATGFPSGLYIYKLQHAGKTITRRMTLMK